MLAVRERVSVDECGPRGRMTSNSIGVWYALAAYFLWGILPVFWKQLQTVPAPQILGHRIVWSCVFLGVLIVSRREGTAFLRAAWSRRTLALFGVAAVLLSVNWLTYIWAVNAGRIIDTSLGYYINPLVSVALATMFLHERLRVGQWVAVGLAAAGVIYLTWEHGELPWVSLVLAVSFALYGLAKKTAPLGALHGIMLETAMLLLPALLFLLAHEQAGTGAFGRATHATQGWLALTGVVTALPLLLFAKAARSVRYSTLGLLQYLSPTCGLAVGYWVYHEPFDRPRLIGFAAIWCALAVYWVEGLLARPRPTTPA